MGNRSERLSSGKLWANINEAFKLEKREKHGERKEAHMKFKKVEGFWNWTGCCEIVTFLPARVFFFKRCEGFG